MGSPERNRERGEALERAVKVWTGQLVDLTARNNLLFFRDLKVGTLDLGQVPPTRLYDLLGGKTVLLSRLFEDPDARSDALRRARAVRNRAQEHFEERGLSTLYLACGTATWTNQRGTATPCAPVLLVPARLAPRGAAQEEFELAVTGELEVNPTLLHMLRAEFEVACDPDELMRAAGIEGAIDTPEELDVAFEWLRMQAGSVPGFGVESRFVLGTFSYAKLPMVKDLEGAVETMHDHELIAALAGDERAQEAVRARHASEVSPSDPDRTPPADEFLVLDADASQNYAINRVLAGEDLVIKGPPGTGKSQTIANLIATLVARGKRVLFVAEKRAAIDAVLRRLDAVGLGDVVLDMHGGVGSRRHVAQALAAALQTNRTIAAADYDHEHRHLETRRNELNARTDALHRRREPWGLSVFDAQARLLSSDPSLATPVRFRGAALTALSAPAYEAARENLRDYAGLGGLALGRSPSPWKTATITSAEQAQATHGLIERVRHHTLPTVVRALEAAAEKTGLPAAPSVGDWQGHLQLWTDVGTTLATFESALFEEPVAELEERLQPLAAGAGSRASALLTNKDYRAARKTLKQHLRDSVKPKPADLFDQLHASVDQRQRWTRLASNGAAPEPPDDLQDLQTAYGQLTAELNQLTDVLGFATLHLPIADLQTTLDALLRDTSTLGRLPELHRLRSNLHTAGLDELLADCEARALDADGALVALEHAWLWSFVEMVRLTDPLVGAFDGEQLRKTAAEFRKADRRHIQTTAHRVRRLVAEQATKAQDEFEAEGVLIRDQAARKRGHLSMRQLFSGAPNVMTALKPCWAMSPLLVSQLLPPDRQYFDVVVFDEASQVRPADAIPAILRARRVVVAGDERQLPPTDFFTGSTPDDAPAMEGRIVVDSGFESILEALLPFLNHRMLGWHYRSRDERLIAFSNVYLYDRGLTTFPGAAGADCIRHDLVSFSPGEVGSDTSTAAEVDHVVDLILQHAVERPDESLGVIAMGIKHADRTEETLRRRLSGRSDLDEFFNESRAERFFIKNLERVQGDERDAIILSVGYGKTPDGRLLYRFGPLNQEGGERRLNVAITRAKNRMTLVSSFDHSDMEPGRSAARGVELLRCYLLYAATQGEQLGDEALDIPELNPFEVDVRDTLVRAGIPLTAQYGASGYRIDFAAQHPTHPGRMVLAIECDGASYHSSETARDRDRLRQEQLERLGWTFHRIWSQDWFNDKASETDQVLAAYRRAVELADGAPDRTPTTPGPWQAADRSIPMAQRAPRPNVPRGLSITEYSHQSLRAIVRWVVSDGLLRTQDEILAEVMRDLGFQKRGSRIVAAITAAIVAELHS